MLNDRTLPPFGCAMDSITGGGFSSINSMSVNRRTAKRIVSRIMYVAKTVNKETSKQHLSSFHSENFQKVVGKADKVTGFLLIYPTCCLHVLEADTTSLMAILRSLQSDASALESIRILSFTEDVTYRFFPSWMAGFINASNLGPYEPKYTKNLLSEISSLNINVLKWGKKLSEMDKTQQAQALDSVRSSTEEFLPDDPAAIFASIPHQRHGGFSLEYHRCLDPHGSFWNGSISENWPYTRKL